MKGVRMPGLYIIDVYDGCKKTTGLLSDLITAQLIIKNYL